MQRNYGQHAAGFSFFGAIGVVATQVAGGADSGVVEVLNAERAALSDNFCRKTDFVMGRADAGTKLDNHVRGIRSEAINHLPDTIGNHAQLSAFATRMHKTNRRRLWIDNVNCTTVGHVNAQCDAALIRDDAVAAGEFSAPRSAATTVDNRDPVPVNLLGCQ